MKENELFKKCIFNKDKCLNYGFKDNNKVTKYSLTDIEEIEL